MTIRLAVLAGVAVAAAGCGTAEPKVATAVDQGDTASVKATSTASGDDVAAYLDGMRAWVKCLRDKGVDASDPDSTGVVTFPGDPVAQKSDPKFQDAQQQCSKLQPAVPESVLDKRKPKLTPDQVKTQQRYAECMQAGGAPDFPDPGPDGYSPRDHRWDQSSPGAQQATRACASIIGDPETPATTRG
ncbi:hypothetical protein [Lentzea sp. NPDC059081]|uniref:hypothetical protein n=1 Tax=Lentzea sp. NPDC059081 TaxID=3346719 RepID=UPI00369DE6E5